MNLICINHIKHRNPKYSTNYKGTTYSVTTSTSGIFSLAQSALRFILTENNKCYYMDPPIPITRADCSKLCWSEIQNVCTTFTFGLWIDWAPPHLNFIPCSWSAICDYCTPAVVGLYRLLKLTILYVIAYVLFFHYFELTLYLKAKPKLIIPTPNINTV